MRATTDPKLSAEYSRLAGMGDNFHGLSLLTYAKLIGKIIQNTNSTTILDYGSGRGDAYKEPHYLHTSHWRVPMPTLYDPAFPELSTKPTGKFDGVVCSDVLEHVPVELLPELVDELFSYANKFVFASVCCRLAKKWFPDGQNMHITIRHYDYWWKPLFREVNSRYPHVICITRETL